MASEQIVSAKARKIEDVSPEVRTILVDPAKVIAKLSDNPRFNIPGTNADVEAERFFQSAEYKAMCESYTRNGVQTPIEVEPIPGTDTFSLLDGWGRLNWAKNYNAKNKKPVLLLANVRTVKDEKTRATLRASFNVSRVDYSPLAAAYAFKRALADWGSEAAAIAALGVSRTTMRTKLKLLETPKELQHALHEELLTVSAVETFMKLPGYSNYMKCLRHEADSANPEPSEAEMDSGSRYERGMRHILKMCKPRANESYNHNDVNRLWNDFIESEVEDTEADADIEDGEEVSEEIKAVAEQTRIAPPSHETLYEVCTGYGEEIAKLIIDGGDSADEIAAYRAMIVHIGFPMGWCVDPEHVEVCKQFNESVTNAGVARVMCDKTVHEFVVRGTMRVCEGLGRTLHGDDPLCVDDDGSAFAEYIETVLPLPKAVAAMRERYVAPQNARPLPTEADDEYVEDVPRKKAKKSGKSEKKVKSKAEGKKPAKEVKSKSKK